MCQFLFTDSLLAAKSLEKEAEKAETLDTTDPEEFSNIKRAATKTLQPRSKKVKKSRPPPPESSDDDESVEDDDEELDLVGFNGHVFSQAGRNQILFFFVSINLFIQIK